MSTAEPTPAPASASFGPVGERKGSVPSGDERLSPYLLAAARAVALPAPRVPGRADGALRSVAQSVTPPRRSYSPAIVRDRARDGCEVDCGGFGSVQQREAHLAVHAAGLADQIGEQLAGRLLGLGVADHRRIRAQVVGYTGLATGKMWARFRQRESSDALPTSTRASDLVGQRRATGTATSLRRRNGRVQGGS